MMGVILYDARYNMKKHTTYEEVAELLRVNKQYLYNYKAKKQKLPGVKCYLLDVDATRNEFRELYEKEKFKNEVWKEIEGSEGKYLISNYGRFKRIYKSHPEGRFVLPYFVKKRGRYGDCDKKQFIKVTFKGKYDDYYVSRLVAYHFVDIFYDSDIISAGKPIRYKNYKFDDLYVIHKNGLLYDNYHLNLEFLDKQDFRKKVAKINKIKHGSNIVCKDVETGKVIGYYTSTRDAAENLYLGKTTVHYGLVKGRVVAGRYKFERIQED